MTKFRQVQSYTKGFVNVDFKMKSQNEVVSTVAIAQMYIRKQNIFTEKKIFRTVENLWKKKVQKLTRFMQLQLNESMV